jgi:hypothetical protein
MKSLTTVKQQSNRALNIEDALFVIHTRTQMIRDLLVLDAAPELFLDKTMDDLLFIEQSLDILGKKLLEDKEISEREVQLDNVSEAEWQFSQVMTTFLNSSGSISVTHFPNLREKILTLRNQSINRRKIVDASRAKTLKAEESLVSSSEYDELLKGL